jgi:hypothetical protein
VTNFLVTLRGTFAVPTVNEIFVHTLAVQSSATTPLLATQVRDHWAAAWGGATGLARTCSNNVKYVEATAATILDLSNGDLSAASHALFAPQPTGTGVKASPSQLAMCVSLVGGPKPNGTPYRGRFYMPMPDASYIQAADGRPSAPYHWADGTKDFFDLMSAAGHVPCVWSRANAVLSPVTQIKVGDRFDTIRRRRNSAAETYVVAV